MKAQEILTTIRYAVAIPSVWQLGHSLRPVSHELAAIACFIVTPLLIGALVYKMSK